MVFLTVNQTVGLVYGFSTLLKMCQLSSLEWIPAHYCPPHPVAEKLREQMARVQNFALALVYVLP